MTRDQTEDEKRFYKLIASEVSDGEDGIGYAVARNIDHAFALLDETGVQCGDPSLAVQDVGFAGVFEAA